MNTSLFGAFSRDGTSSALGNDNDSQLLGTLRDWSDVVLVTAGTVRMEHYGKTNSQLAIVSHSLELDLTSAVFFGTAPIIFTDRTAHISSLRQNRITNLRKAGAHVIEVPDTKPHTLISALKDLGFTRVSCEGGPSLYASLLSEDLIDVIHLTITPTVSSCDATFGLKLESDTPWTKRFKLESALADSDGTLFCRYRKKATDVGA